MNGGLNVLGNLASKVCCTNRRNHSQKQRISHVVKVVNGN
ncbi:hypothetical protein GGE67_001946 [Rhizobium leucaenae]|uniref:Uncharacterized protein n=1 Tax=Rhizobium leucaenae TaxID=29450 RepID=A0A7W6ZQ95_9HYPH|nr:hypothetical protein [Rhizobium leucaenae]MBB6301337.1 hypothetical protein [Rhizobium leucaenae]